MRMQMRSCSVVLVTAAMILGSTLANAKSKYVCDEPQPADKCNTGNTCGSASTPCTINIQKIRGWRKRQAGDSGCEGQSVLLYKSRHFGRVDDLK